MKINANWSFVRVVLDPRLNWSFILKDRSWDIDPVTISQKLATTTRQALHELDPELDPYMEFHVRQYIELHGPTITADERKLWKLKFIDCWRKYKAAHFPNMRNDYVPQEMTAASVFLSAAEDTASPPPPDADADGVLLGSIPAEISQYFTEASIPLDADPLLWWKTHERKYPVLAHMARDILAIPASSAEPERVHSGARTVLNWNQSRMGSASIEASVAVKCFSVYNSGNLVWEDDLDSVEVQ